LRREQKHEEIVEVCTRAAAVEPFDEKIYQFLMQAQLDLGNKQGVVRTYESMSALLFNNFGVMPDDESRAIYRRAIRTVNDHTMSLDLLREQLDEDQDPKGAFLCDYDFFRVVYRAIARAVPRSGEVVHIALLSAAAGEGEKTLSRRSLDCCMENLEEVIVTSLRKGDVVSRCSVSQYIIMLPQANFENSCMVCERIIKAFVRQYPHSPAHLRYMVQPLLPNQ
jgi:hypothetical protein